MAQDVSWIKLEKNKNMDPKFVISHNGPIMGKKYFFTCLVLEVGKTYPQNLYNFKIQSSYADKNFLDCKIFESSSFNWFYGRDKDFNFLQWILVLFQNSKTRAIFIDSLDQKVFVSTLKEVI